MREHRIEDGEHLDSCWCRFTAPATTSVEPASEQLVRQWLLDCKLIESFDEELEPHEKQLIQLLSSALHISKLQGQLMQLEAIAGYLPDGEYSARKADIELPRKGAKE